jgi:hypothetical protein
MKKSQGPPPEFINAKNSNAPLLHKRTAPGGKHFIAVIGKRSDKSDQHIEEIKALMAKHISK